MATTVLRTVYPTNSYDPEIAGVPLITLAGVDVDNTKLTAVQARAVIDGVILVSGGVAGSPSTASPVSQPNVTTTTPGPPVSGTYAVGQLSVDSAGSLWVCTGAGSPGTWQSAQSGTFGASSYTYNGDGTVATETAGGVTTTYTYNADGSVHTAARSGTTLTYSYNGDGTIASVA